MLISHISVSRKKCYDLCARQYLYKYHLKHPSPEDEPEYFGYGKIVHKIAETYVQEQGNRKIGEIAQDVLRGKIPVEDGNEAKNIPPTFAAMPSKPYMKRLPKHLRAIVSLTDKLGFGGITEQQFRIDLDPPNERFVLGFLDRLIPTNDNGYIIADYKTTMPGPYRVDRTTVGQDLQLRAYAYAVQHLYGTPAEKIKCVLFYLEDGKVVGTTYKQSAIDAAKSELLECHKQITAHDPANALGRVGFQCARCDYRSICPYYKTR